MLADLKYRLRAFLNRAVVERELDDELQFHLEREIDKYVAQGFAPDEAMRRARIALGGVERIKDDDRDARGLALVDTVSQDVRYALRGIRMAPSFAAAVILTLGLGVGANAAMFGVVDRLLFRSPPGLRAAAFVHRPYFRTAFDGRPDVRRDMSIRRYLDFVRETKSFDAMAAFQTRVLAIGTGDQSRERPVAVATASFFTFFDAPPALGRYFGEEEDRIPEGRPVAVLSHALWMSEYGGRQDVLGKHIRVDRMDCTIIGVAAKDFVGVGDEPAPVLFVPISAYAFSRSSPRYVQSYGWSWPEMIVRRRPDVSVEQATADLSAAYVHSLQADPRYTDAARLRAAAPRAELRPIQFARGPQAPRESRLAGWVGGVAIIVLLIACANVSNLLLSRGLRRRRELALRMALGVTRRRLVQQLATETLVFAAAGALCGLVMARWLAVGLRVAFLSDGSASVFTDIRTIAFAAATTLGVALLTTILPAVQASRSDIGLALNAAGRDADATRSRTRAALVVAQAALCVVLLVGAGWFLRSFAHVRDMRLGYEVDPIVVVNVNYRGTPLNFTQADALDATLLETAKTIPGVTSASLAESVPFWSNDEPTLFVDGVDSVARIGRFLMQAVSPEYFATAGTRIIRGRAFDANDRLAGPQVLIVTERMAKTLWPAKDPLGQCVRIGADTMPCTTVVGIAEDMRLRSLSDPQEFSFLTPAAQYGTAIGTLFVRVDGDAADHAERIRKRLQELMPGTSYVTAVPLASHVAPMTKSWRFGAVMFTGFGSLALVLAALGLYAVMAYAVTQRRREIGLRMALGASRRNVARLVVGGGVRLTALGIAIGVAAALVAGRWVEPLLFEQTSTDVTVIAAVGGVLLAVSAVATAVPAAWASRVDPNVSLRAE